MSEPIRFSDYKQQILNAINEKMPLLKISESATLIDGFITQPLQSELSGAFVVGGPMIPMIALVGKDTGRMYFFALKAILPNISL